MQRPPLPSSLSSTFFSPSLPAWLLPYVHAGFLATTRGLACSSALCSKRCWLLQDCVPRITSRSPHTNLGDLRVRFGKIMGMALEEMSESKKVSESWGPSLCSRSHLVQLRSRQLIGQTSWLSGHLQAEAEFWPPIGCLWCKSSLGCNSWVQRMMKFPFFHDWLDETTSYLTMSEWVRLPLALPTTFS